MLAQLAVGRRLFEVCFVEMRIHVFGIPAFYEYRMSRFIYAPSGSDAKIVLGKKCHKSENTVELIIEFFISF